MSAHEQSALWRRLQASVGAAASRRRHRLALAISAPGLAIAAVLIAMWWARDARLVREASQQRAIAARCALDASAPQLRLPADCAARSLTVGGDEWSLSAGAEVLHVDDGARVVRGRVRFHVRPRTAAAQFRVRVSHGEVRVVGTVFQVEQLTDRGSVAVTQGVIEFVWEDGTRERVAAGQTLDWPRPAPAPTVPALRPRRADAHSRSPRAEQGRAPSRGRHGPHTRSLAAAAESKALR